MNEYIKKKKAASKTKAILDMAPLQSGENQGILSQRDDPDLAPYSVGLSDKAGAPMESKGKKKEKSQVRKDNEAHWEETKKNLAKNAYVPDKEAEIQRERYKQMEKEAWEAKYKQAGVFSKAGMKIKKGFQGLKQTGVDAVLNMKDDFMESHNKAYNDLILHQAGYKSLSKTQKLKHTLSNPLAHIRFNHNKAYHELEEHPEKYESLSRGKKIGHVLANPAAHIHWNQKKKKLKKEKSLEDVTRYAEKLKQKKLGIPEAPALPKGLILPEAAPKTESWEEKAYQNAAKQTMQGSIKEAILAYGMRKERERKLREEGRENEIKSYGDYLTLKPVGSKKVRHIGEFEGKKEKTKEEKLDAGKGIFNAVKTGTGLGSYVSNEAYTADQGLSALKNIASTAKNMKQGDSAESVEGMLNTVRDVAGMISTATGMTSFRVASGAADAMAGGKKVNNARKTKNAVLERKAENQEMQDISDQMLSQSETAKNEGTGQIMRGVAVIPGAFFKPVKYVGTVGNMLMGSKANASHERTQHMVGNQEINLDEEVNRQLAITYGDKWKDMTDRERKRAGKKMRDMVSQSYGVRGGLDELVTKASQKRAKKLVDMASSEVMGKENGIDRLLRKMGLKENKKTEKFSEDAVGKRLYSRNGETLAEHEKKLKKAQLSEDQSGLYHYINKDRNDKQLKAKKKQEKAEREEIEALKKGKIKEGEKSAILPNLKMSDLDDL